MFCIFSHSVHSHSLGSMWKCNLVWSCCIRIPYGTEKKESSKNDSPIFNECNRLEQKKETQTICIQKQFSSAQQLTILLTVNKCKQWNGSMMWSTMRNEVKKKHICIEFETYVCFHVKTIGFAHIFTFHNSYSGYIVDCVSSLCPLCLIVNCLQANRKWKWTQSLQSFYLYLKQKPTLSVFFYSVITLLLIDRCSTFLIQIVSTIYVSKIAHFLEFSNHLRINLSDWLKVLTYNVQPKPCYKLAKWSES